MAFGAGWTTARDRGLLIQLGRWAGARRRGRRARHQRVRPRHQRADLRAEPGDRGAGRPTQKELLVKTYGEKGRQILADAQAYADGVNAYWKANNITQPPATVNDVIAVTAFIGSIFGAGGGGEASNSRAARASSSRGSARCAATRPGTT